MFRKEFSIRVIHKKRLATASEPPDLQGVAGLTWNQGAVERLRPRFGG